MFIIIINLTRACAVQGYSAHRVCLSICLSVSAQKHILRVNWRKVEFAAIYTLKVLTIDTHERA